MSAVPEPQLDLDALTGSGLLSWAKVFLDYTDAVVGDLPEDDAALDWRWTDAAGTYYFSIREQAMHIADTRHDALSWVTGEDVSAMQFCIEYGGTGKPWVFKPASREQILASLLDGRAAIDAWLAKPLSELLRTTPSLVARHEEQLESLRKAMKDTSEREDRGPSLALNIAVFLIAHEQSHRTLLQTMLRQQGHSVTRYA